MVEDVRAIALLSGGLDSALAAALTLRLGFGVVGVNLATGFCIGQGRCDTVLATGQALGIPVRLLDVSREYLDVVRHPRHGYGSGMNPCIDCRIFMVRKAGEVMAAEGAAFVVTGEVLGQRPMSQHRRALELVAEESGLGDRVVRPLSGRLLPATYPERQGWVRRDDWLDIQGRSRRRQLALAQAWGIHHFLQPSGGCCLLLEKAYAARLRDASRARGLAALDERDFALLRYGRHFRISPTAKVIVSRDETENVILNGFSSGRWTVMFPDVPGPLALVEGTPTEEELGLAVQLAARYSDARPGEPVRAVLAHVGGTCELTVVPLPKDDPRLVTWKIGE
ncbi:MAG: hypothetical protein NUV94_05720 [Candidatus Acetothermia bacterium]|jgi:tRNA U34 2-thiouridine synthase MnmA/TrmU|nr:hypothetical protein [Candidatus Acetothermia bacterium]